MQSWVVATATKWPINYLTLSARIYYLTLFSKNLLTDALNPLFLYHLTSSPSPSLWARSESSVPLMVSYLLVELRVKEVFIYLTDF